MSTLVGYNSSSDEEQEETIPKPTSITTASDQGIRSNISIQHSNGHACGNESYEAAEGNNIQRNPGIDTGPMVGPAMPTATETQLEEISPMDQFDSVSERDTIRYLTQPSHPMTSIPPSPPGSPDPALNAKFKRFLELKVKGVHFNDDLGKKPTFRNPSLLATLMDRAGLDNEDQYRTSIPLAIWDPLDFPAHAFKEELLRSQQTLRDQQQAAKKSQSAAGKRTIEFTSGRTSTSGQNSRDSTPGISSKRKRG
ncbi:uncharacterized protein A1O9_10077 [Exophiala aquamarina CBS 119918]|uniref:HCNGP-like protein n=1 Tax=Exophiala aquamarina CBS 119918 TaxID=1182545 RepID=A0A072P1W1_9EURO|nr:uncharacterized protein A1O9_10077 [Exophiala aquamarina CBS 119918]KEF53677.1 hypothetical protein A1O9_10077 [Exophiala aquamarina CBS 119918]